MNVKQCCAVLVAVIMLGVSLQYSWLTAHGEIQPMFATWFLWFVAANLSLWTYRSGTERSLIANVGNTVDVGVVWLITLAVVAAPQTRWHFTGFEFGCLATCALILIGWRRTGDHVKANLALQLIMSIAYLPTLAQLATADRNTESIPIWVACWTASAVGLIPACLEKNKLAMVYAGRTVFFVTLMLRLELR